jgi:hypothetical protein
MQPQDGYGMPQPQQIHMSALDPRLEQYGGAHDPYAQYDDMADPASRPLEPQYDYGQDGIFEAAAYGYPDATAHPGMATLMSPRGPWDQPMPGADFDEELGKWPI